MDSELPPELVALLDIGVDLLGCEERAAAETRLAFVVLQRPSGRPCEPPVGRHFPDGANAEPVVAVACLFAELFELGCARLRLTCRRRVADLHRCARQLGAVIPVQKLPFGVGSNDARIDGRAGFDHAGDAQFQLVTDILE